MVQHRSSQQGSVAGGVIASAPETQPVMGDDPTEPVLFQGKSFSPPQATGQNKASALTDGTVGSLSPTPPQENLSCRREILDNGFLERDEGLWYDSTILEQTSRSWYWRVN